VVWGEEEDPGRVESLVPEAGAGYAWEGAPQAGEQEEAGRGAVVEQYGERQLHDDGGGGDDAPQAQEAADKKAVAPKKKRAPAKKKVPRKKG